MDEKFWANDPCYLFMNSTLIPQPGMSLNERLNAATRLLLVLCLVGFLLNIKYTLVVLIIGLIAIFVSKMTSPSSGEGFEVSEKQALDQGIRQFAPSYDTRPHGPMDKACWIENEDLDILNAKLQRTPLIQYNHFDDEKRSYMNAKYELTPLTDTNGFKDIWRGEPEMCGSFDMPPNPHTQFPVYDPETRGECNYIVRSKIDHLPASQSPNGLVAVRAMAEQDYNDSAMKFRNAIMNDHIDYFRRERQHNCADMPLNGMAAGSGVAN